MRLLHSALNALAALVLSIVPGLQSHLVVAAPTPAVARLAVPAPPAASEISSFLGVSGNLRARIGLAAALRDDATLTPFLAGHAIEQPGVHALGVATPEGDPLVVVALESFAARSEGSKSSYRTGAWPAFDRPGTRVDYAVPEGFIPVTLETKDVHVSKRFQLGDFLTHDQQGTWPKVLVLRPVLLDKLELIGDSLVRRGLPGRLHVMSGFRTPQYNALGVGEKGGRAKHSRHMYGDAADIFVDADGDGRMDDLDHDGRVTVRDARLLLAVAEGIEAAHPELVGGLSAYPANSAHGPFVHVDARGVRARW